MTAARRETDAKTPRPIAYLTVELPGSDPKRVPLFADVAEIVVGRQPPADIVVDWPTVSRDHVHLRLGTAGWQAMDRGSTNGTYVDGAHTPMEPRQWLLLGTRERVNAKLELGRRAARLRLRSTAILTEKELQELQIVDPKTRVVQGHLKPAPVQLSRTEYLIYQKLHEAKGELVRYGELCDTAGIKGDPKHRQGLLAGDIHTIRGKLDETVVAGGRDYCHLLNVKGLGYRLLR